MTKLGRPRLDRQLLFTYVDGLPRRGRHVIAVNERLAATALKWSRSTVGRGFSDLEREGLLYRWKPAGRNGVLVVIEPGPAAPWSHISTDTQRLGDLHGGV